MKVFMILISGREIFWNDCRSGIHKLYPTPSKEAIHLFGRPTKEEVEEYKMCKNEKELSAFCIRDAKKVGAKLIKMEEIK